MSAPLLVIEPNLRTPSGHYAEFVRAMGARGRVEVYAHPDADAMLSAMPGVHACAAQPRVGRPLAEWHLILHAVREGVPFLVLTADGRHAAAISAAASLAGRAPGNACLFFHRPPTTTRDRMLFPLGAAARRHALAVAPTREVARALSDAGWRRVELVPYPALGASFPLRPAPFSHLLMAGAARLNKGLDLIAGLASLWAGEGRTIPLRVQVSTKHVGRHGHREGAVVDALLSSGYKGLRIDATAPDRAGYLERFRGALVLAPYEREPFASQVSGVVLDALLHGAPVVTTRGTWPGSQVERFGAGLTIGERTVLELARAVDRVLADWPACAERACGAGVVLAGEHDPRRLLEVLEKGTAAP